MSQSLPPAESFENAGTKSLDSVHLRPTDERFEQWLSARSNFMHQKGWREGNSDWDRYDDDPATEQIVMFNEKGEVKFGMRLTQVFDFKQSLSWEMVAGSAIGEQVLASHETSFTKQVWDLTRLVPGQALSREDRAIAIPKLFGEGLRYCWEHGDENPIWIFALDQPTDAWLRHQGVEVTKLGEGRIGFDKTRTIFGMVRPAEIAIATVDSSFTKNAQVGRADVNS